MHAAPIEIMGWLQYAKRDGGETLRGEIWSQPLLGGGPLTSGDYHNGTSDATSLILRGLPYVVYDDHVDRGFRGDQLESELFLHKRGDRGTIRL